MTEIKTLERKLEATRQAAELARREKRWKDANDMEFKANELWSMLEAKRQLSQTDQ